MWKTIPFENAYEINTKGDIRNKETLKIKSTRFDRYGYKRVTLYPSGKTYTIHSLVAKVFIDNPKKLKTVNHINGNKLDNTVENLEWLSYKDNTIHAHKNGLIDYSSVKGIHNPMAKFTKEDIENIFLKAKEGKTTSIIANELGFPYERVRRLLKGKSYR